MAKSERPLSVGTMMPQFILLVLFAVPLFFIIRRLGLSYWWMLVVVLPVLGGLILLWILAFIAWPKRKIARGFRMTFGATAKWVWGALQ